MIQLEHHYIVPTTLLIPHFYGIVSQNEYFFGATRTIHPNGTLEFHPLIANADLTPEGIEYYCRLSNDFGSIISRTAILKLASKLICCICCANMLQVGM